VPSQEAELAEVRREEFSEEGQGVSYTLLSTTAFSLMAVYLVNWNDDDVRRYAWDVISMALSIFTSLLAFVNLTNWLEGLVNADADVGVRCMLGYSMFILWFGALLVAIGFSSGVLCSTIPDEEFEMEDWVVEDEMLTSHKDLVDASRIVYKRWGRAIATDDDNHPVFCRQRNLAMEEIEGRMRSLLVFFSHTTAFAATYAGVALMHVSFFAQNALCSLLAVVINLLGVFLAFRFAELFTCRGKMEKLVDLFFEAVDDAEIDVLGLSASYLLVSCLAFGITGMQSNFELYQMPSSLSLNRALAIFASGLAILVLSVVLVVTWRRKPNETAWRTKTRELSQSALSLVFSWCAVRSVQWTIVDLCKKQVVTLLPASLVVLLASALTMSAASFVLILPLDKIEDRVRSLGGAGRIFKDVIIALGVVVGVSWEPVFNKSVAVAAHSFSNPPVVRLLLSAAIVLLLLPAWKRFVLTKQISYTETRSERRSRSYLTKDQDVLNPPQSKQEFRGCGFA